MRTGPTRIFIKSELRLSVSTSHNPIFSPASRTPPTPPTNVMIFFHASTRTCLLGDSKWRGVSSRPRFRRIEKKPAFMTGDSSFNGPSLARPVMSESIAA